MKKKNSPSFSGFITASILIIITVGIFILLVFDLQNNQKEATISNARIISVHLEKKVSSALSLIRNIEKLNLGKKLLSSDSQKLLNNFYEENKDTTFTAIVKKGKLLHKYPLNIDKTVLNTLKAQKIIYNDTSKISVTNIKTDSQIFIILAAKFQSGELLIGISNKDLILKNIKPTQIAIRVISQNKIKSISGNLTIFNSTPAIFRINLPEGRLELAILHESEFFGINSLSIIILLAGIFFSVSTGFFILRTGEMKNKIKSMSYHDHLTGLPNRIFFTDRFAMAMARAKRYDKKLAVIMLDLDKFKYVNNTYGYKIGDMLLQRISQRLLKLMRETDSVVRSGGDEFIILLPDINTKNDLDIFVDKLTNAFKAPYLCGKLVLHISFTMGSAIYPEDGDTIDALIKKADINIYKAKNELS